MFIKYFRVENVNIGLSKHNKYSIIKKRRKLHTFYFISLYILYYKHSIRKKYYIQYLIY